MTGRIKGSDAVGVSHLEPWAPPAAGRNRPPDVFRDAFPPPVAYVRRKDDKGATPRFFTSKILPPEASSLVARAAFGGLT